MLTKAKFVAVMILKRKSMKTNVRNGTWRANHVSFQKKTLFGFISVAICCSNLCFMFGFEYYDAPVLWKFGFFITFLFLRAEK